MIKLSAREKLLLKVLIVLIFIVVGYNFLYTPLVNLFSSYDSVVLTNRQKVEQLDKIYANYKSLETKRNQYMSLLKSDTENISTLIEQWAQNSNIAKNIANDIYNDLFLDFD